MRSQQCVVQNNALGFADARKIGIRMSGAFARVHLINALGLQADFIQ